MVHDDYKEMIPARALSALDAAEERVLNEHLENCAECRKELEDWQATAAALSLTLDPSQPIVTVWTLPGRDFVCVEPWTRPSDAVNRGEALWVAPQQTHEAMFEIRRA